MMIAAMIAGGIWAFIPAFFKAKWKTNETIFTLMMNYIALGWITYLQYGPWKDPKAFGFAKIPTFSNSAVLPKVFGIHIGWIIALIFVGGMHFFMNHTKKGYEISVIGESENTAKYAGIPVEKLLMGTLFASGAIIGLTGMIQASAVSKTLSVQITGGIGFTAIITAWLSGLKAPLMVVVCFLFSIMVQGGSFIQTAFQIPQAAAEILQGLILFFVLGSEFFVQYRLKLTHNFLAKKEEV
jgi:simple sugar transport system permease protein